jgi:CBS domain-containing protein
MQVNRAATMQVEVARPDEPVAELAKKMKYSNVGFLPVVEGMDKAIGVVTDRDIVLRVMAEGKDPERCYAREIMSSPVYWVYEDTEIDVATKVLMDKQVRRLLIKERNGTPVGVLSLDDLAVFTHGDQTIGRVLDHVAQRALYGRDDGDFADIVD